MRVFRDETSMESFEILTRESSLRPAKAAEDFTSQAAFAFAEDFFEAVEHVVAILVAAAADEALMVEAAQVARLGRFREGFALDFGEEELEENRPVRSEELKDLFSADSIEGNIVIGSEAMEEVEGFGVFERRDFADIEIVDGRGEPETSNDGFQPDGAGNEKSS